MTVTRPDREIFFINSHEIVFGPGVLAGLLNLHTDDEDDGKQDELIHQEDEEEEFDDVRSKLGPKRRVDEFPTLLVEYDKFIKQHSFSAQERRRSETANFSGVSLASIRRHLLSTVPGLGAKGLSRDRIHRYMVAPKRHTLHGRKFEGLIKGRVGVKQNNVRKLHEDHHFLFSQVRTARECAEYFRDFFFVLSCDGMNKVNVGVLAVSRYHQIRTFFPLDDAPNYPDHDFPFPNSKIAVDGYMELKSCHKKMVKGRVRSSSFP
jgi:hypothetical protein